MKARFWIMMVLVSGLCSIGYDVSAGPGPAARARHADKNKDGKVTPKEWHQEKKWEHHQKAKVNTPWEAKADANKDGVVQPVEAGKAHRDAYLDNRAVVNRPWEVKADQNHDGRVSAVELRAYHLSVMDKNNDGKIDLVERKAFWVLHKSKVNTELEQKYDKDGNGWIDGAEARELLKDRLILINTHGKAKVDTPLEANYDADNDGVIDKDEAEAIRDSLGED